MLSDRSGSVEKWLEICERTFNFARHARYWFEHGTLKEKFEILRALGSNLILKDKKLQIELKTPFIAIGRAVKEVPSARYGFEPEKFGQNEAKLNELYSQIPIIQRAMNEVRTWIMGNYEELYVPNFD